MSKAESSLDQYRRLAYRRSVYLWVISQLDNKLPENYLADPPEIFCEFLPQDENQVPSTVVLDVLSELRTIENQIEGEMAKFRLLQEPVRHEQEQPSENPSHQQRQEAGG